LIQVKNVLSEGLVALAVVVLLGLKQHPIPMRQRRGLLVREHHGLRDRELVIRVGIVLQPVEIRGVRLALFYSQ